MIEEEEEFVDDYDPSMWEEAPAPAAAPAPAPAPAAAPAAPAPSSSESPQANATTEVSDDIASILTAGFGEGWKIKES